MADFEVLEQTGRFVFGSGPDFFGIWDKRLPDEPIERFPPTEEGFDAAETRFREVKRLEREQRGLWPRALWTAVWTGALIWIITGVAVTAWTMITFTFPTEPGVPILFRVLAVLDQVGFRIAIGGLFGLGALLLVRWERRSRPKQFVSIAESGSAEAEVPSSPRRIVESALRGALVAGVAVWIASALATQTLSRYTGDPFEQGLSKTFVAAQLAESIAFRIWVAALVLLIVYWGRAWIQQQRLSDERPTSA